MESKYTTKKKQSESKREKEEVWLKISNTLGGNYTPQQIQKFYENARSRAIEKERKNLAESRKTGGGPPVIVKLTPVEELIISFANRSEPLKNVLDSSNPEVIEITENSSKRSKLDQTTYKLDQTAYTRSNELPASPGNNLNFLNILKTTVLCTQGLAEAQRLEDSEIKERLLKRYKKEIKDSLDVLSEEETI